MKNEKHITKEMVDALFQRLHKEAEASGYHLNPDVEFTKELVDGLLKNEHRYGYWACPCRLASGNKQEDLDIICPCDYRDPDLNEHGACYCALYVSHDVVEGKKDVSSIPERRPPKDQRTSASRTSQDRIIGNLAFPVWRCRVCGYMCARDDPPEVCPVCKAKKDRFEKFM